MMHGPLPDQDDHSNAAAGHALVAALERALALCNRVIVLLAATDEIQLDVPEVDAIDGLPPADRPALGRAR